jgi:hypothetical protein
MTSRRKKRNEKVQNIPRFVDPCPAARTPADSPLALVLFRRGERRAQNQSGPGPCPWKAASNWVTLAPAAHGVQDRCRSGLRGTEVHIQELCTKVKTPDAPPSERPKVRERFHQRAPGTGLARRMLRRESGAEMSSDTADAAERCARTSGDELVLAHGQNLTTPAAPPRGEARSLREIESRRILESSCIEPWPPSPLLLVQP